MLLSAINIRLKNLKDFKLNQLNHLWKIIETNSVFSLLVFFSLDKGDVGSKEEVCSFNFSRCVSFTKGVFDTSSWVWSDLCEMSLKKKKTFN